MKLNSSYFKIPIIHNVLIYDTISSTNDKAKELAKRGSVDGTLVIGRTQTAGKGRMGRSFSSPKDEGIYMSLMLRPDIDIKKRASLTLVTALAVVNAINELCHITPQIKWPNDIVIDGKKIVGILTEAGSDYVVIGIGINVNNQTFPDTISSTATSVYKETNTFLDNAKLIYTILTKFSDLYNQYLICGDLSFMVSSYNKMLANFNQEVYLIPHNSSSICENPYLISTDNLDSYLCMGIDNAGNLICRDKHGEISHINSGEISLRGIHGYSD